jgi:hypothetical protein
MSAGQDDLHTIPELYDTTIAIGRREETTPLPREEEERLLGLDLQLGILLDRAGISPAYTPLPAGLEWLDRLPASGMPYHNYCRGIIPYSHPLWESDVARLLARLGAAEPARPPAEPASADDEDVAILRALAGAAPRLLTIAQLASQADVSERTVGPRLNAMIERGHAYRPKGKKSGATITAPGREYLRGIRT